MNSVAIFTLLFAAGGIGALCRLGLSSLISDLIPSQSILATSVVNIFGCIGFGILAELFRLSGWSANIRLIILTGFFGAFTTFSTYMYEIETLTFEGNPEKAILGFTVQNIFGFLGIFLGILLARLIQN